MKEDMVFEEEKERILASEMERFVNWLITVRGCSRRVAEQYGERMHRILRELNTLIPTMEQCNGYRDKMMLNGRRNSYVAGIVKTIRNYGRFTGRELMIKYPPKERQKMPQFLTDTELKQMLFASKSIKERLVIMALGGCGLRVSEACRLKIEDIDFDDAELRVQTTKTDSVWNIPLSGDIIELITAYIKYERPQSNYTNLLLSQYGEPYNPYNCRGIRMMIHKIAKRAKIQKRVHPHMLRHSFATLLLKNGCQLPYVQLLLRHRDIKSTIIYTHIVKEDLRVAYDRYAPLQIRQPNENQAPFEQEQRLPSQNSPYQKCELHQSDYGNTKTLNHKRGSRNGYM